MTTNPKAGMRLPFTRDEAVAELRLRYPSAFDGSDPLDEQIGLKVKNASDWVLAFVLAAAPVAPAGTEGEALRYALVRARYHVERSPCSDRDEVLSAIDEALAARAQPPAGSIEVEGGTLPNGVYRRDDGQRLMVVENDEVRFYTAHPTEPAARDGGEAWRDLSPEDQYELAQRIASNVGYELAPVEMADGREMGLGSSALAASGEK